MLHFRQSGSGPNVVLLHGLFGSLENLGSLARILSQHFTVYSVDLPNHGRSQHVSDGDLSRLAMIVGDWISQLGLDSPALIGHSLGGKVAMEVGLHMPSTISKIVVMDISPVAYPMRHEQVFEGLFNIDPQGLKSRNEADATLREYVEEDAVRTFLLKNLYRQDGEYRWRANLLDLRESYLQLVGENAESRYDNPTLFVKGGQSDYIQSDHREEILKRFPNALLKVVEGTGHWLHAEKPELVANLIRRFLE